MKIKYYKNCFLLFITIMLISCNNDNIDTKRDKTSDTKKPDKYSHVKEKLNKSLDKHYYSLKVIYEKYGNKIGDIDIAVRLEIDREGRVLSSQVFLESDLPNKNHNQENIKDQQVKENNN